MCDHQATAIDHLQTCILLKQIERLKNVKTLWELHDKFEERKRWKTHSNQDHEAWRPRTTTPAQDQQILGIMLQHGYGGMQEKKQIWPKLTQNDHNAVYKWIKTKEFSEFVWNQKGLVIFRRLFGIKLNKNSSTNGIAVT